MTMTTYTVMTGEGGEMGAGLTYREAREYAQELADERGETVYVSGPGLGGEADEDIGEAVEPSAAEEAATLDALLEAVRAGLYSERQMTKLPTYGGPEPRDTAGVWSWDATRLLVGTCSEDFRLVPRDE
jgi:hypothetical protein